MARALANGKAASFPMNGMTLVKMLWAGKGLGGELARGGVGSLAINVASLAMQLLTTVILARAMGPESYGTYAFALALTTVVMTPIQTGITNVAVRFTATYHAREEWSLLKGLRRRLFQWTLGYGVIGAGLLFIMVLATGGLGAGPSAVPTLGWAILLLVFSPLVALFGGTLRGLRHTVLGLLPENIILPLAFLAFLGAGYLLPGAHCLDAEVAMALRVGGAAIAVCFGYAALRRYFPEDCKNSRPLYGTRMWARTILPLSFLGGMMVVNSRMDILMLGWLAETRDVGVYRVAVAGATLVTFMLSAVNMVVGPQTASLWAQGRKAELQRMLTWGARVSLAAALPVAILFWVFGADILRIVFGEEFVGGHLALAILCVGQTVNAAAGSVGFILNMTGHERDTLVGVAAAAVLNIILNVLLIPSYGYVGAAIATASSVTTWNMILISCVWKRTGLNSLFFGIQRTHDA